MIDGEPVLAVENNLTAEFRPIAEEHRKRRSAASGSSVILCLMPRRDRDRDRALLVPQSRRDSSSGPAAQRGLRPRRSLASPEP